ncbi:VacJ family lipoprotein [Dyella sp. A6]|uniref:MlaA family lipoprotein n=1 Tax=Dyella aluminiiresistens TaxID=3069105 RepID=UPI002E798495|nr:VacJ family lipoprotein [Dyella sp. A6]
MPYLPRIRVLKPVIAAAILLLAGCAIAPPRTDDPLQHFNRKVYAFNSAIDKAAIRPVAVGYRKVTNPPVRRSVSNFFSNLRMPITVANDLLQARPKQALVGTGRFLVNLTLGIGGIFDPATAMGIPDNQTDFGITLARWGVPEGDFLMLPLIGPTTVRDVWRLPVDSYFFDPLSYVTRNHKFHHGLYYTPTVLYLISLRAQAIDAESFLDSAYDPYAFLRDAYRQQRINMLYDGNPPASVIDRMQGLDQKGFDPDLLLEQQRQWEKQQKSKPAGQPKPSGAQNGTPTQQ